MIYEFYGLYPPKADCIFIPLARASDKNTKIRSKKALKRM